MFPGLRFFFALQHVRANHLNVLLRIRRYVCRIFFINSMDYEGSIQALKSQSTRRGAYYCTKLSSLFDSGRKSDGSLLLSISASSHR